MKPALRIDSILRRSRRRVRRQKDFHRGRLRPHDPRGCQIGAIRHAVWPYLRFTPGYRDVEELLAERGLDFLTRRSGDGPEVRVAVR